MFFYVLGGPEFGQVPHPAVARYGDHPVARSEPPGQLGGAHDVDARRRTKEQTVASRQVPAHLHSLAVVAPKRARQQTRTFVPATLAFLRAVTPDGDVEVTRQPVDTHALGDGVERVLQSFALRLHRVVQDPPGHLVVQRAPLRIHQVALDQRVLAFEIRRDTRQGPTRAARAHERVQPPAARGHRVARRFAALSPNLGTGALEMRPVVSRVLKLIRKVPQTIPVQLAHLSRASPRDVHEVVLVRDGHRPDAFARGAVRFHEPRLLCSRVVWKYEMRVASQRPRHHGQRYPGAAGGTFCDCTTADELAGL